MRTAIVGTALLLLAGCSRAPKTAAELQPKAFGTALVEVGGSKQAAAVGTALEVEIRGNKHAATVVGLPFYKRQK